LAELATLASAQATSPSGRLVRRHGFQRKDRARLHRRAQVFQGSREDTSDANERTESDAGPSGKSFPAKHERRVMMWSHEFCLIVECRIGPQPIKHSTINALLLSYPSFPQGIDRAMWRVRR
jgi:hypothetical protein